MNDKGVHREVESEGSRTQKLALTNCRKAFYTDKKEAKKGNVI
ncbi:hypothetical protein IRB23SM22_23340 [Alkalibacterium sp. s-m-22]